jgi:hypothetical protein
MNTKTVKIMAAAIAGGLFLCGCASTYQQRSVSGSGFLSDYSQLKDRGGDTAMLSYVDSKADFRSYNKILIDPIRAYAKDKDSGMAKMSKEDQQHLLNYFDATLREQLKKDYILVNEPGPGVLRLRIAITEAKGSKVVMDTMSSVMPPAIVLGAAKKIVTGSNLAVGSIGAECEGVDSLAGKRLFAAVDARAGRKYTGKFDKFSKWHAANDAMDFWAEQLQTRLASERAVTGR